MHVSSLSGARDHGGEAAPEGTSIGTVGRSVQCRPSRARAPGKTPCAARERARPAFRRGRALYIARAGLDEQVHVGAVGGLHVGGHAADLDAVDQLLSYNFV